MNDADSEMDMKRPHQVHMKGTGKIDENDTYDEAGKSSPR